MDRRAFLSTLLGSAAALAFDPERLLWVPGAKTIFLPPPVYTVKKYVGQVYISQEALNDVYDQLYMFCSQDGIYVSPLGQAPRLISQPVHP